MPFGTVAERSADVNKTNFSSEPRDIAGFPSVSTFTWDFLSDCATLSAGAQALLGVSSPISVNDVFERIHPDDRLTFEAETVAHLEAGGDTTREFRILRLDGTLRHVIAHTSLQRLPGGRHARIEGLLIDVTPDRSDGLAQTVVEERLFGSYDFNVEEGISVWSPALRQMFMHLPAGPVTVEEIHRSVHPDDREWVTNRMQGVLGTPGPYEFAYRVCRADGRILWVRDTGFGHAPLDPVTGKVRRVTGTLTDITRNVEHIGADKLVNDTFWRLVDTAPFGAYVVDAELRMVRISSRGRAAFAEIDNLLGRDIGDILRISWPAVLASDAVERFRHTLATGEPYRARPFAQDRADRKVLEAYDWSIERMVLDDGQPGVLCYFYDLSERVRNERSLEEQQRRLSFAYEAAEMGAWEADLLEGVTTGTSQLAALFGDRDFNGDYGELWRRSVHPEDRSAVDAAFETSARTGEPFETNFRILTPEGDLRYLMARGEVVHGADGRPAKIIGIDQDITKSKMIEIALRESEARLRTIINNTLAFVSVLDTDGTLREVNQPALDFGGLTRDDVTGKLFCDVYWWTHDEAVAQMCRDAVAEAQAGRVARCDVVVRGAGDRLITIDFMLAPIFGDDGEVCMLVASGFDISSREEARAHAQILMGEINHRSKNILTLVQAVARQTARGGSADFVSRFEERLSALAKAQDLLFHSVSDRVDLRDLANSQLDHFADLIDARIHLSGPRIGVGPQAAQAIGMALHELATNAGKYGALSSDDGRVDVMWTADAGTGMFEIRWEENGGPRVDPPQTTGFGSTVINQMTQSVLDAEIDMDFAAEGVRWRMVCELSALT